MAVDAHPGASRRQPACDAARRGPKILPGIFRVDAHLNRMALEPNLILSNRDRQTASDAQLLGDQVDTGNHLSDRVLHLNAGVHLHEIKLARSIHQELHRAGALVADGAGRRHGRIAHLPA